MFAIVTNRMGWVLKSLVVCVALMAIQTTARAESVTEGVPHTFPFATGPLGTKPPPVVWRIYWDVKFDSMGRAILGKPTTVKPTWVAARQRYESNVTHTYLMGTGGTLKKGFLVQEETWTTTNHSGTTTKVNTRSYPFSVNVLRSMNFNP